MKVLLLSTIVLLGLVGCSHSTPAPQPQPPVVVTPPPAPTPTPAPVADGHWCVTGGGFSPCAPHNPVVDSACVPQNPFNPQEIESDCRFNACYAANASCPAMQKSMQNLGPRPVEWQLKLDAQLKK